MKAKTRKYLIIGLEVVVLLILLSIIVVVETQHLSEADKNRELGIPSFNHNGNATNITVEDVNTAYGNYTIRRYSFTDGTIEERLYYNTGNASENVANILVDQNDIVLGVL